MLKRLRWFVLGAVSGVAATLWGVTVARSRVRRLAPAQVAGEVSARARSRVDDLRDALLEGRLAMRARERELRAELDRGRADAPARPALAVKSSPN